MKLIQLNVVSAVALAKRLLPQMRARGRGRVLFTSSFAATTGTWHEAVHGAANAFVLSFAAALSEELRDSGITVTSVLSGPTEAPSFHRAGMNDVQGGHSDLYDPPQVAEQAFEALMAGHDRINAGGVKSRFVGAAARLLPEAVKARWHVQLAKLQASSH
jgi:short-subunit dehydrogenase